jgi:hypothetical protein
LIEQKNKKAELYQPVTEKENNGFECITQNFCGGGLKPKAMREDSKEELSALLPAANFLQLASGKRQPTQRRPCEVE